MSVADFHARAAERLLEALAAQSSELSFGLADIQALLEAPKERKLGDIAFPCFRLAKELRQAPPAIAQALAETIEKTVPEHAWLEKVVAAGPYVNFFLSKRFLAEDLVPHILSGDFLAPCSPVGSRLMIEYSQPNTHKAFHVGHTRNAVLGDALVRINEWLGYDVVAANYPGDEGTHVARCLWYYLNHHHGDVPELHRGEFLGKLYTAATEMLDLASLSAVPFPGVIAAKVEKTEPHPKNEKWLVVMLDIGGGRTVQVVAGVSELPAGTVVAYATPGAKIVDRTVREADKQGVKSCGMICSEKELGISEENKLLTFEGDTPLGAEIADLFPNDKTVAEGERPLSVLQKREQEVSHVLQRLEEKDPEIEKLWQETRQWSLDELADNYAWLDCRFDHYFFESEVGDEAKALVREHYEKGTFVKDQGTIGANLSDYGLGFAILIKSDGTATYAARDLALAPRKFTNFNLDRSIYVVDFAQTLHFEQVFKCLELMGYPWVAQCQHAAYGLVMGKEGKFSSRKGNAILFSDLVERLNKRIYVEFLEKYRGDWPDTEIERTGKAIALATIRYGMLKQDSNSNITFDLNEWTERSGDTGPYMMYAYARTRSILREVNVEQYEQADWSLLTHESEADLLMHLLTFRDVVHKAGADCAPNLICSFAYELAKLFNQMYRHCSVKNADSPTLQVTRAALVDVVGRVLAQALGLLGIEVAERM